MADISTEVAVQDEKSQLARTEEAPSASQDFVIDIEAQEDGNFDSIVGPAGQADIERAKSDPDAFGYLPPGKDPPEILKLYNDFQKLDELDLWQDKFSYKQAKECGEIEQGLCVARDTAELEQQRRDMFVKAHCDMLEGVAQRREYDELQNRFNELFAKLPFAVFGGVLLIIPMIIMVLSTTKLTCLLTTSIFTILVAIILASVAKLEVKDIVVATFAYAAVLIVFVAGSLATSAPTTGSGSMPAPVDNKRLAGITIGVVLGLVFTLVIVPWICTQYLKWRQKKQLDQFYKDRV